MIKLHRVGERQQFGNIIAVLVFLRLQPFLTPTFFCLALLFFGYNCPVADKMEHPLIKHRKVEFLEL